MLRHAARLDCQGNSIVPVVSWYIYPDPGLRAETPHEAPDRCSVFVDAPSREGNSAVPCGRLFGCRGFGIGYRRVLGGDVGGAEVGGAQGLGAGIGR